MYCGRTDLGAVQKMVADLDDVRLYIYCAELLARQKVTANELTDIDIYQEYNQWRRKCVTYGLSFTSDQS